MFQNPADALHVWRCLQRQRVAPSRLRVAHDQASASGTDRPSGGRRLGDDGDHGGDRLGEGDGVAQAGAVHEEEDTQPNFKRIFWAVSRRPASRSEHHPPHGRQAVDSTEVPMGSAMTGLSTQVYQTRGRTCARILKCDCPKPAPIADRHLATISIQACSKQELPSKAWK